MTAVAFPVTAASAVRVRAQSRQVEPGFALYVGMSEAGVAERALLADLAQAVAGTASTRARTAWQATQPVQVVLDTDARTLTIDWRDVALTFKEFALLEYLLRSARRAVSREELLETVWHKGASAVGTRTIDVHVRRLREKLGGCLQIVTVRGVGYRCDATPENVLVGSGDAG